MELLELCIDNAGICRGDKLRDEFNRVGEVFEFACELLEDSFGFMLELGICSFCITGLFPL